nr:MAG TPA: hypothetical protein [Caudoviricetes sp.]
MFWGDGLTCRDRRARMWRTSHPGRVDRPLSGS